MKTSTSLYKSDEVKKNLEQVLKYLAEFAYKFRFQENIENKIKGELATLMRRFIPHLSGTQIGFNVRNIDNLYFDCNTGKILYIRFIKSYSACYDDYIIDELNKEIQKLDNNFSNYALGSKLSTITKNVSNIKFKQL